MTIGVEVLTLCGLAIAIIFGVYNAVQLSRKSSNDDSEQLGHMQSEIKNIANDVREIKGDVKLTNGSVSRAMERISALEALEKNRK